VPVNIQIAQGNFSFGVSAGLYYTLSNATNTLQVFQNNGTPVATFPITLAQLRSTVLSLKFDGTFFWSLELLPSSLGITIKKWRLFPFPTFAFPSASSSELRWQDELTLINNQTIKWSSHAFCVEHYPLTFSAPASRGDTSFTLTSASHVAVGDTLYLGPSGFGGFIGNFESVIVTHINGNTISFTKTGGLENSYLSLDPVNVQKAIWIFNNNSFTGKADNRGILIKFSLPSKLDVLSNQGMQYATVAAADFNNGHIVFVRGDQIMQIDVSVPTLDISSSMEANLRESDLFTPIVVYDIIADLSNNQVLKLQQKETNETISTGTYITTDFTPKFNYQSIPTLPFVNSTSLDMATHFTYDQASGDTIAVTALVRDQFNLPVSNKTIKFTSALDVLSGPGTPGTFNPTTALTNTFGIAATTYTPSSTQPIILVDITAQVQ